MYAMIDTIWQIISKMYSFFSWRIFVPLVEKMTMQHSTKKSAVNGMETILQKPDLTFFSSLN